MTKIFGLIINLVKPVVRPKNSCLSGCGWGGGVEEKEPRLSTNSDFVEKLATQNFAAVWLVRRQNSV